jgi:hypothetical protein
MSPLVQIVTQFCRSFWHWGCLSGNIDRQGTHYLVRTRLCDHSGTQGNEHSDALAREELGSPFLSPEPAIPVSSCLVRL